MNFISLKLKGISFFVITAYVFYMAVATPLATNDYISSVVFLIFLILFFAKRHKIDRFIVIILFIWMAINFMSFFKNEGLGFSFQTLIGVSLKIILPYFMVKLIGPSFFDKLTRYVYILVLISLPIYFLGVLFPDFLYSVSKYLNFITYDRQKQLGGWYIFVYMHNIWAYVYTIPWLYRNSGFMWEPGALAMIITFVLTYHLIRNDFKLDRMARVFILTIITTFSTSGAIALIFMSLAYSMTLKEGLLKYVIIFPVLVFISYQVYNLDFVSGKIDKSIVGIDAHRTMTGHESIERVNRIAGFKYSFEQTLYWPFGNGVLQSSFQDLKYGYQYRGPNTFAGVLLKWGFIGFIFLVIIIYRFYRLIGTNSKISLFFTLALSAVLFSNPAELKPLIYSFAYFVLLYKKNQIYFIQSKLEKEV